MQQPLVSILIPAYNEQKTIRHAIESCLSQTYRNIEILVVDDASEDGTIQEILKFSEVILVRHDKNLGRPSARNTLLRTAKGELVAWLDADDLMMPNRIERQVEFMLEHPETDIAGSWIFTDNPQLPEKKLPTDNKMITAHLWFKNCMVQPSIISRNFYMKENIFYETRFLYMQDYELWIRLRNQKIFANIPEFLTSYHFPENGDNAKKQTVSAELKLTKKLWDMKWTNAGFNLSKEQRHLLEKFLLEDGILNYRQGMQLKLIFNRISESEPFRQSGEKRLMIHLYRLLAFKRLNLFGKLICPGLLFSLRKYKSLRRMHLIQ